jgi:hypothetical protein
MSDVRRNCCARLILCSRTYRRGLGPVLCLRSRENALELQSTVIKVNAACPGYTRDRP